MTPDRTGTLVKAERKRQGLTMRELAYFAAVSHATIQRVENGTLSVSPQIMVRIARALRVPVADLWPLQDDEARGANADIVKTSDAGGGRVPS